MSFPEFVLHLESGHLFQCYISIFFLLYCFCLNIFYSNYFCLIFEILQTVFYKVHMFMMLRVTCNMFLLLGMGDWDNDVRLHVVTFFLRASRDSNSRRDSLICMCFGTSGIRKAKMNLKASSTCWKHRKTSTAQELKFAICFALHRLRIQNKTPLMMITILNKWGISVSSHVCGLKTSEILYALFYDDALNYSHFNPCLFQGIWEFILVLNN